jgi:predicted nucleic-acid-binding Zn-ribbon protein
MSAWILKCVNCGSDFQHSQISDVGMSYLDLPRKPDMPKGVACVCPNCGYSGIYKRTDLLYRA